MRYLNKWTSQLCIVAIAAAFLLGLYVTKDYGNYIDQALEEKILMLNIKEYANILLGEDRFEGISQSIEQDHGVAFYYPLGVYWGLRTRFGGVEYPKGTADAWHLYTFFLFFQGCLALYAIVYELFRSRRLALFSFFLYYLTPRFFAEGHYNNKDVVFLTFGLVTVYFAMRYIGSRQVQWGIAYACVAAFMTNIKIVGAWFFVLPGLIYLFEGIRAKALDKKKVLDGFLVIFSYCVTYTALTPAFLRNGFPYIRYCMDSASRFTRWGGNVVYAGRTVILPENTLPWDYLPLNILYTVPLVLLLFSLIGMLRGAAAIVRKERNAAFYVMTLALYLLPFLYAVSNRRLILYTGWRHFYFVYGGMAIFMAVGSHMLLQRCKGKWARSIFCGGIFAYLLFLVVLGHPYQYSYINILAERPAQTDWPLDYWLVGSRQALSRLYECGERNQNLKLSVAGCVQVANDLQYDDRWNGEIYYVGWDVNETGANYAVCNMANDPLPKEGYHLLFTIEAYGNTLYQVYEKGDG